LLLPHQAKRLIVLIIDSETEEFEVLKNTAGQASRGAGISAAQLMVDKGIRAVIAGNFGPNAVNVLNSSGVKIFACPPKPAASGAGRRGSVIGITAKEVVGQYKAGKLKETTIAATPFGPPANRQGMGMDRGRGWGRKKNNL
jgi:hypothetical protein